MGVGRPGESCDNNSGIASTEIQGIFNNPKTTVLGDQPHRQKVVYVHGTYFEGWQKSHPEFANADVVIPIDESNVRSAKSVTLKPAPHVQ